MRKFVSLKIGFRAKLPSILLVFCQGFFIAIASCFILSITYLPL
jgi:hypothetical protein